MSRNSKARRDARRKKEPRRPIRRLGAALQPHAQLEDADGNAVGGAGWRDREWLTVLGGQVVARTHSAAMTLAMLRHIVALQEQAGGTLKLTYSPVMEAAATREAEAAGKSLEDYLVLLEQERQERSEQADDAPADMDPTRGEPLS
ncbi:hypothetical protein ACFPOA_14610 [Lysobacter niabensis]|uniref:hypothetical protein n=1 Tax=Agrilutibacter niabensis TaxID=380628 RepID=UPI00361EE334